jgi:Tfp pilus assembly protein PilV
MMRNVQSRLNQRGISVVELMVGVVLLAVVVVSLAASGLYAQRTLSRSRVELQAAEYVQAELERLLAIPYFGLESGSRETESGKAEWIVTDLSNHRRILLVTTYAPTAGITVTDTVVAVTLRP